MRASAPLFCLPFDIGWMCTAPPSSLPPCMQRNPLNGSPRNVLWLKWSSLMFLCGSSRPRIVSSKVDLYDFPECLLHLWEYQSPALAEHGQLRSVAFLDGRARKEALSYWKLCVCHRVLRLRSVEPRIRDPSCLPCRPLAAWHSGSASTMDGSKSLCNLYFIVHWSFMLPRMYATSMRAREDPA